MATDISDKLDTIYRAGGDRRELDRAYDAWAASYDQDLWATGNPYIAIMAVLCGRHIPNKDALILDGGCGTGNLGAVLAAGGFTNVEGLEPSTAMRAASDAKGCYVRLHDLVLDERIGLPDESYDAVAAAGVLTVGHAPPAALDGILAVAKPGAPIVFSISKPAAEDYGFGGKIAELTESGAWRLLERTAPFRTYPFIDGYADLRHWICVYQKAGAAE